MREPGDLDALGPDGLEAWNARLGDEFARVSELLEKAPCLRQEPDPQTQAVAATDWTGLPARVVSCLGRRRALELLDWRGPSGDEGRRALQHEYVEWRVVDDREGPRRIELTTELPEYWEVLAAYQPAQALELVAEFAQQADVPTAAVYGPCDPFAKDTTPSARAAAFRATMVDGFSPYNTGREAITCLVHKTNRLDAVVTLATAAAGCGIVDDEGWRRSVTCNEAIPLLADAAEDGRGSDPLLVERIARLAFEGRSIAFDDPLGIYIAAAEHSRLRTRDGEVIPPDWFTFGRGIAASESEDGIARFQRATLEVPEDAGFGLTALTDIATEEPIRFGGQIAELLQLVLLLRAGKENRAAPAGEAIPASHERAAADCEQVEAYYSAFESDRA